MEMRTAVEFADLYCTKTKEPSEDEVSLKFDRSTLWSGPIRSGLTKNIGTIKVIPDGDVVVELWHDDGPRRTISKIGAQPIQKDEDGSSPRSAQFSGEGGDYTLSYRFLQIPD